MFDVSVEARTLPIGDPHRAFIELRLKLGALVALLDAPRDIVDERGRVPSETVD